MWASSRAVYHEKMGLQVTHSSVARHLHSTLKVQGSTLKTSSLKKSNPTQPKPKPSSNKNQNKTKSSRVGSWRPLQCNAIESEFLQDETNTCAPPLSWFALIYIVSRADHWGYFPSSKQESLHFTKYCENGYAT